MRAHASSLILRTSTKKICRHGGRESHQCTQNHEIHGCASTRVFRYLILPTFSLMPLANGIVGTKMRCFVPIRDFRVRFIKLSAIRTSTTTGAISGAVSTTRTAVLRLVFASPLIVARGWTVKLRPSLAQSGRWPATCCPLTPTAAEMTARSVRVSTVLWNMYPLVVPVVPLPLRSRTEHVVGVANGDKFSRCFGSIVCIVVWVPAL